MEWMSDDDNPDKPQISLFEEEYSRLFSQKKLNVYDAKRLKLSKKNEHAKMNQNIQEFEEAKVHAI